MIVWNGIASWPSGSGPIVATIGNYDGVHLGHRAIVRGVVDEARRRGATSVLVTFEPHPLAIVAPERRPPRIQTRRQRLAALEALDLDEVRVVDFDRGLASLDGETFFTEVLLPCLPVRVKPSGPQEMERLAVAFNNMASRLQSNVNELRAFVANASHELRTPLTVVKLRAEALREGALEEPEVATRFLSEIETEIDRLVRMVNDLLDLSRMEAGMDSGKRTLLNLGAIAHEVYETFGIRATRAEVELTLDLEPGLPPVMGNEGQLRRVFYNLVENAIKYTPCKGQAEMLLRSGPNPNTVRLLVRDSGPGIAAEHLPHVFERFYRAETTQPRPGVIRGSGLGLAIANGLIGLIRSGKIKQKDYIVVNCTGHTLPIEKDILGDNWARSVSVPPQVLTNTPQEGLLAALNKVTPDRFPRILIVDDMADARRLIRRILQSQGSYTVFEAQNGFEAMDITVREYPDLIILDLMMPEIDGFAVLDALKANPDTAPIPVIVVTAKELTQEERARPRGQIHSLMQKGEFMNDEFMDEIAALIG